jgi:protein ImuB
MVAVMQDGNRRIIAAADEAARRIKLHPGMTLAHAQSLVPDLHVVEAVPLEDEAALGELGLWCTRPRPLSKSLVSFFARRRGPSHFYPRIASVA